MEILGYNLNFTKKKVLAKQETRTSTKRINPKVLEITDGFRNRSRKDIDTWRMALMLLQHPEEPKYQMYYDLVDDLMTDGHLQSQIQMRKMSTLNTGFEIINRKTGKVNEELTHILNQQWFYNFLEHCLDAIFLGTTVVNFTSFEGHNINLEQVPRRNIISTQSKFIPDLEKEGYIDYSQDAFKYWLIEIGKKGDIGVLNNIIPNLIWIRNVMQSWAEFCEKFGQPLLTAETNTTDTTTIENVHQMLLKIAEASVGTFPKGTEVKFHEASRTDAYNTYLKFLKTNQDIISKQLVGSTMLSDEGTSRSQTEVHERTLDDKIAESDKRSLTFIVNDQLLPLLRLQGYAISEDDTYKFKKVHEKVTLPELWVITEGMLKKDLDVDLEWISKAFNIPIKGKKKSLVIPKASLKTQKYPVSCCPTNIVARGSEIQRLLQELTSNLISNIYNKKEIKSIMAKMIIAEGLNFLQGLRDNFKTFSPYTGTDVLTLQMMEYNVLEFSASKTEARLVATNELLIDSETNTIRSFSDFKELAEKETKLFNTDYLLTEYNLAVSVGQNSASYLRFLEDKDTVTNLVQYQTAGDDKVRNSHRILDGIVLDLDDTEAMDLYTPNGFGCRCEFIQYLGDKEPTKGSVAKELLFESDGKYKGSQFEINRGNLKQVFTKKQFYNANKTTTEIVNDFSYKDYGAKAYSSFKKDLSNLKVDKTITSENIKELFKSNGQVSTTDFMGFKDYLKRKIILKQTTFTKNTKEIDNGQLFPHVKNTLNQPDEVWYTSKKEGVFSSLYLSFFKDKILVVEANMDAKSSLEISNWYYTDSDKDLRKGLKIK